MGSSKDSMGDLLVFPGSDEGAAVSLCVPPSVREGSTASVPVLGVARFVWVWFWCQQTLHVLINKTVHAASEGDLAPSPPQLMASGTDASKELILLRVAGVGDRGGLSTRNLIMLPQL